VSEARTFKVKSSLSKQLFEPGGRLVRDAERLAGEALDTHRDEAMAMITATLDELEGVCAAAAEGSGPQVYSLGARVIDLAAFFDTGPLHDAAWSLCEVSDRMINGGIWHWPSVPVHLQAMRLILASGCRTGRTSQTLLEGLRKISQRP
jgi:hypothetical protein